MDAIMIALVAVLLANADGRAGSFLSRLLSVRNNRRLTVLIAIGAFILNALAAAIGGTVLGRMVGQGVIALFVAFALLSAAAALLWRGRLSLDADALADVPPAALAGRLAISQLGDRSHFLIGALAATSGAGHWAAAGGLIGWILAMLPFLAFGPALAEARVVRGMRWVSAVILLLWGARIALTAFGLIEK